MGVFNASLVLPALMVPGLLKVSNALQGHRWMFLLFAACLLVSFAFWCAVRERAGAPDSSGNAPESDSMAAPSILGISQPPSGTETHAPGALFGVPRGRKKRA
jgi:hypothetical protein